MGAAYRQLGRPADAEAVLRQVVDEARALVLSRGDWAGTLSRPIVLFFFVATALSLLAPLFKELRSKRRKA